MQSNDILRGCMSAYVACVIVGALAIATDIQTIGQFLGVFGIGLFFLSIYGILPLMPSIVLAFVSFAILRRVTGRAHWWHSVLAVFVWAALVFVPIGGSAGGLIWASLFGAIAGSAFWWGAAGWRWSAPMALAR